jgi:hypothetical protein
MAGRGSILPRGPAAHAEPIPDGCRRATTLMSGTEQRLRRVVEARLEPDEVFVAWTRAWVSRYRQLHWLLSVRNRDYAVVTDRRLMLWSAGFFTRRPRRRVLAERLDEVTVESTSRDPGRRMACSRAGRRPLLLELGKDARSDRFSIELRDRASAAALLAKQAPVMTEPAPAPVPASPPPLFADVFPESPPPVPAAPDAAPEPAPAPPLHFYAGNAPAAEDAPPQDAAAAEKDEEHDERSDDTDATPSEQPELPWR